MTTPNGPAARQMQLLAAAQTLGLALTAAQITQLLAYLNMLQRWSRVYNLTALRDPAEMLSHHLIDCLAILPPLQRWCAAAAPVAHRVLDVGSGGGLPGVVLAALQPGWQVDCIDTVLKKVSFIRQVAAELRLTNLQGMHARVESLVLPDDGDSPGDTPGHTRDCTPGRTRGYTLITSRAFASLADFTALTRHLLAADGVWVAMKGKVPVDEQAALPADVEVFHVEQLQVPGLGAQRCLVWMRLR